jgi:cupin fold WbuC family metalloprotein
MKIIDESLLNTITDKAKESPRLRMNYNLHENLEDSVQKLLNALEPGTELPIHRHTETAETYYVVRGHLKVIFYNDNREIVEECELSPDLGKYGVDIPAGQWHTIQVIDSGTVIFEVKQGPYRTLDQHDIL